MDRREQLSQAWEKTEPVQEESVSEKTEAAAPVEVAKPEVTAETPAKEDEKHVKEESPYKKEAEAAAKPAVEQAKKESDATVQQAQQTITGKPPNSWKPEAKAKWSSLPAEARAEITRLDKEVQKTLSQTDQIRKFASEFAQTVQPFSHLISMQHSTPLAAVKNLMTTAAGLMQGTQEQKARIVCEIIANYGVDIRTLDTILSQSPNQTGSSNTQNGSGNSLPPSFVTALQPIYGFMDQFNQARQQRQQQLQEEAADEVDSFAEKPFFEDLREEMADLMEMAANKGRKMTMQQAYDKAMAMNPEYAKAAAQQNDQQITASQAAAILAKAKKASSTVSGGPTGAAVGAKPTPGSRREMLAQLWDEGQ